MVANQKRVAVEHEEKALQKKMKMLTRSQRTHRLCEQGAILGAKLKEPDLLTAEQVKAVLDVAFSHSDVQELLQKYLEQVAPLWAVNCVLPKASCREPSINAHKGAAPAIAFAIYPLNTKGCLHKSKQPLFYAERRQREYALPSF